MTRSTSLTHRLRTSGTVIFALFIIMGLAIPTASARRSGERTCGGLQATIRGTSDSDWLIGTEGNDIILGLGGDDVIKGRGGDDVICGGRGNDALYGDGRRGAGNDTIISGPGEDVVTGGPGTDTMAFYDAPSGATVYLATGVVGYDGWGWSESLSGVENLVGSAYNDVFTGDANANTLEGADGDDLLIGIDGGTDTFDGGEGADTINSADADQDTVTGGTISGAADIDVDACTFDAFDTVTDCP